MEDKQLIEQIAAEIKKSLLGEIRTTLINSVKDEMVESLTEKLLSDEKGSLKQKLIKELIVHKKADEQIELLQKQLEEKDFALANKESEIKQINNKTIVKKAFKDLDIVPYDMDIVEKMIDTKGDIKEDDVKKQINAFVDKYPFMFKSTPKEVNGFGDVANYYANGNHANNGIGEYSAKGNVPMINGVSLANAIKKEYGGYEK